MTNEEKILEMLGQMREDIAAVKNSQSSMADRLDEMDGRLDRINSRMTRINGRLDELESNQAKMQDNVTKVNLRLELDVEERFAALNEDINLVHGKLDMLTGVKELTEETRDKVDMIYTVVKQHSGEIRTLKQAQ